MKSKPTKSLFLLSASGLAILFSVSGCGNISEYLEKRREQRGTHHGQGQINIKYEDHAPEIGGEWTRDINVSTDGQAVPSVIVEARRHSQANFLIIGVTDEHGMIQDSVISEHTKYRIGAKIITEWKPAKRDLVWTDKTNLEEVIKAYAPLELGEQTTTNLSNPEKNVVTIDATRIQVDRGANVFWNRNAPLAIVTNSLNIDGTLSAFPVACKDGRSAPVLQVTTTNLSGAGTISWSGCAGANGSDGESHKYCDDGGPGQPGQTGGSGNDVLVSADAIDIHGPQMISSAGRGGLGGNGGRGGKGIYIRGDNYQGASPCYAGKNGKNGAPGADGRAGTVKLTLKNLRRDGG